MNTKALWIILIIVLIGIGAWFAFMQKGSTIDTDNDIDSGMNAASSTDTTTGTKGSDTSTTGTSGTVGASVGVSLGAATHTITYSDQGFSPSSLSVKVGDTVTFMNQSSRTMWAASDAHPTHTQYDGTSLQQHCATGTSFDECKAAANGGSYSFTFTKAGTFNYHNHVRAADNGTIVVK